MTAAHSGNDAVREALARRMIAFEQCGRSKPCEIMFLAAAAVASALIAAPIAAQAQSTVGVVGGNTVVIEQDGGIIAEQRPAFREYVVRGSACRPSRFPIAIVVGTMLPEAGVTYYDVPQRFGGTPYRYTVVNGATVLVEPRSTPYRSGDRLARKHLNEMSGRRAAR